MVAGLAQKKCFLKTTCLITNIINMNNIDDDNNSDDDDDNI